MWRREIDKQIRQQAIRDLIGRNAVATQRDIVAAMRDRGMEVTQASVSRDIREMGLIKLKGRYMAARGAVADPPVAPAEPVLGLITGADPIGANLIVVRTAIGAAGSVGNAIDSRQLSEVAGTIAGDDTLFIAVRSRSDQGRLLALLNGWLRSAGGANGIGPVPGSLHVG